MTNPYRAMCAELLDWADRSSAHYYVKPDLLTRARALLAQPVADGPTDEELREMLNENDWDYISPWTFEDIARTVLARWGHPKPQPRQFSVTDYPIENLLRSRYEHY